MVIVIVTCWYNGYGNSIAIGATPMTMVIAQNREVQKPLSADSA